MRLCNAESLGKIEEKQLRQAKFRLKKSMIVTRKKNWIADSREYQRWWKKKVMDKFRFGAR